MFMVFELLSSMLLYIQIKDFTHEEHPYEVYCYQSFQDMFQFNYTHMKFLKDKSVFQMLRDFPPFLLLWFY